MNAVPHPAILGRGIYPIAEAARLAQLPVQTARRWADGNSYRYQGTRRTTRGLIEMELPTIQGRRDLTFPELLTLRMVRAFRTTGLGLPTIKRVAEKAAREYGSPTPLVLTQFRTDGRRIFVELKAEQAVANQDSTSKSDRHLIDMLSGQAQFAEVVEPSLFRNLEWQDVWQAAKWWPAGREAGVVLDPNVLFGAPRLAETSLATSVIAQSVSAESGTDDPVAAVAEWHGITAAQVRQAVVFEREWRNAA